MTALSASDTLRTQRHHHTKNNVQKTMLTSKQNEIIIKINFLSKIVVLCKAIREKSLQYDDNKDLKSCILTYI